MKVKKLISLILISAMAFSAISVMPSVSAEEGKVLLGDVNLDGKVNIRDVTLVQKYVANLAELSEQQLRAIDTNGDSKLNVKDATSLQKFIAGVEESEIIGVEITEAETTEELKAEQTTQPATEYTKVTESVATSEAAEAEEETTWIELGTEPAETSKAAEAEEETTWVERGTEPTDTSEALEATEESTWVERGTEPSEPAETTEATEETTQSETLTEYTEISEITESSKSTETSEYPGIFEGALGFSTIISQRIGDYGTDQTQLYLVKSMEELIAVHEGVIDDYGNDLYDELKLSELFDSEYFEEKSLVISFNCVGGSLSKQSIDGMRVEGDVLTVSRTFYQPFADTCDMNYQYVLMEVDAQKVEYVTTLKNSSRVLRGDENGNYSDSGNYGSEPITVYFTNGKNWEDVYIYYWGEFHSPSWPGTVMEYVGTNEYSQEVFKAAIPGNIDGIIFSGGLDMPQTHDIYENIRNGNGYYPMEFDGLRWSVGSYIFKDEIISTTETKGVSDSDNDNVRHIPFSKIEECRVESYGSDSPEIYIVRSVAEFQAVLDKISGDENGSYIRKPCIPQEIDDAYFMSNSLVISLSCVGGSNCSQRIDGIAVDGDTLMLHRVVYKPMNVTCDMNYQYVLLEVNSADIIYVTQTIDCMIECQ